MHSNFNDLNNETMTAKEYYNNQDRFEYFTKLTNTGISDDFDEIMAFAEAYHEHKLKLLGIADVVGQSEQLVCPNCKSKHIGTSTHKGFLQGYCFVCSNHWAK